MSTRITIENSPAQILRRAKQSICDESDQIAQELCGAIGSAGCVFANSVEEGICISLISAGVMPGEKVLCSGFAPPYVRAAIMRAGAFPLRVDINPNSFNIDPFCLDYAVGKCIRDRDKLPKAIIVSDIFGLPCNYDAICRISDNHDMSLIEDMGDAFGAEYCGNAAGSFGRFSVAALPDVGAIFCQRKEDREIIKHETLHRDIVRFVTANLAAAWLRDSKIRIEKRGAIAEAYRRALDGVCRTQHVEASYKSAYTGFAAVIPNHANKAEIIEKLSEKGIVCGNFKPEPDPIDTLERIMLVNAKNASARLITLPIDHNMTIHMADKIAQEFVATIHYLQQQSDIISP